MKKQEEIKINIHLFDNVFIGSDQYQYFIYEQKFHTDKHGDQVETKNKIGHYTKFEQLIGNFMDKYLLTYSSAKDFSELRADIEKCKEIIKKIKGE